MTVRFEVPYVEYVGNGIAVDFPFDWSSGDANDNYVLFNGELQIEGVLYELEEYTPEFGGVMRFKEPPTEDDRIIVYRDTPVTQEVDYEEGKPFPAETHERQMDKDTRILQEIITAGKGYGGIVDLSADQQPAWVDIVNSSGTDARILPWTTDGLKAGVSLGEVIEFGGTPPSDGAPTTKPDGYIWWVLGEPQQGAGDPNITMPTALVLVESYRDAPETPRSAFSYNRAQAEVGFGYDQLLPSEDPVYAWQSAFALPVSATGQYLIQMEQIGGIAPDGEDLVDTWIDASNDAEWWVSTGDFYGIFHIAPDLGGGTPDTANQVSRRVTLKTRLSG